MNKFLITTIAATLALVSLNANAQFNGWNPFNSVPPSSGGGGGGSGTVTSVTLAPGFTRTVGTQNTGSDAITTTGTINSQLWPVNKAVSYSVAAADTGVLLITTAAAVVYTMPNPAAGTKGTIFQLASDGTNGYSITTVTGTATIYGCNVTSGSTTAVIPAKVDVFLLDDGANYKCMSISGVSAATQLSNGVTGSGAVVLAAGGAVTGLTGLAIRDTSAAFDVTLVATSSTNLSAGRILTIDMKNVAHTLALSATANTITFPNTASYTLVGSGDTGTVTNTMLAGSINLTTKVTDTLPYGNGGTGATTLTNHGAVVAGASALSTIAPGTNGNVLTSNGTDWTSAAAGAVAGGGLFQYADNGLTLTAATRYIPIGGSGTPSTTEADYSLRASSAMTANNLQVNLSADPGSGQTMVITLRVNNADSTLTCTVTGPLTPPLARCQDVTHSVAIAQNDLINWKVVTTGTFVATPSVTITSNSGTTNAGITGSGTTNTIAKFTGSASAGNSSITDDGTTVTLTGGLLFAGASGTLGSVKMGNATSGTVTLAPVTGALGTVTASLPANTGTIAELNLAQTFTAKQTFTGSGSIDAGANSGNVGAVKLFGNTSGDVTIKAAAAAGTATNFTLPASNGSNTNVLVTDGSGNTSWSSAGGGTVNSCDAWITATSTMVSGGSCGSVSAGTWTSPSWVTATTNIKIEACGAGGGGGGSVTAGRIGYAGGGGGLVIESAANLIAASTGYTFVIGSLGAGGVGNGAAGAGTATTLLIGATTYTANGGSAGTSDTATFVGTIAGGTASNGNVANITGGAGGSIGQGISSAANLTPFGIGGELKVGAASSGAAGTGFCVGGSGSRSAGSSQTGGAGLSGLIHIVLSGA